MEITKTRTPKEIWETALGELQLQVSKPNYRTWFGKLLNSQQDVLKNYLGVSSPKLDQMIAVSLEQGALGAKINGSGEGGCIFAYCPENASQVAESLRELETKTYIIHVDEGVKLET